MIFKQRLFTLLLGLLFATVLTDQASALYDPGVGRFCSRDPIGYFGLDCNLTRLVFNRPLVFVDPSGNGSCEITIYMGHDLWVEEKLRKHPETKPCEKLAPICCGNVKSIETCKKNRPGATIEDWPIITGYLWCDKSAVNQPDFERELDSILEELARDFANSIENAAKELCKQDCKCHSILITPKCDYTPEKKQISDCMKKLVEKGVIAYNWCFNRNRFNCNRGLLEQPMIKKEL